VDKEPVMAAARLSQLQKRILCWVAADDRRTKGVIASSHQELVRALQGDKGNIRLCWVSQKHAEKQSCIQRLKTSEIEPIPLVSLAPMTLQIGHGVLPNRVNISHSLRTLEARNLLVIGRSSGGKAEYPRLTPEGQKWVMQLAGSCD
jgi:hypothetical protein